MNNVLIYNAVWQCTPSDLYFSDGIFFMIIVAAHKISIVITFPEPPFE